MKTFKYIILLIIILCISSLYYLFFTNHGSMILVDLLISKCFEVNSIDAGKSQGNLLRRFTYQDITLSKITGLPEDINVTIKSLQVEIHGFSFNEVDILLEGGKLKLPRSDPLLFSGTYKKGIVSGNVTCDKLDFGYICKFLRRYNLNHEILGTINNIDIAVNGPVESLSVDGDIFLNDISCLNYHIDKSRAKVDLILKDLSAALKIFGEISLRNLNFNIENTPGYITIQEISIAYHGGGIKDLSLEINNGNIEIPGSDIVLFYGEYQNEILDFNLYSRHFLVKEFINMLPENNFLKNLSGTVAGISCAVSGKTERPIFSGALFIEKISKNSFSVVKSPCRYNLAFFRVKQQVSPTFWDR